MSISRFLWIALHSKNNCKKIYLTLIRFQFIDARWFESIDRRQIYWERWYTFVIHLKTETKSRKWRHRQISRFFFSSGTNRLEERTCRFPFKFFLNQNVENKIQREFKRKVIEQDWENEFLSFSLFRVKSWQNSVLHKKVLLLDKTTMVHSRRNFSRREKLLKCRDSVKTFDRISIFTNPRWQNSSLSSEEFDRRFLSFCLKSKKFDSNKTEE